jgi:GTP cyclohydrolase II
MELAEAHIRARIVLPLQLADGYQTTVLAHTFDGLADSGEHVALGMGVRPVSGRNDAGAAPLVRVHSECLTGDVLGSQRCDCGPQLGEAVRRIDAVGGYLLYLRQEGRGIGLYAKLDAYALQDAGLDTYEANLALGFRADARDYTVAAQMLRALGHDRVRLLTNNPDKAAQLSRLGITIEGLVPTALHLNGSNARYMATKALRGAHTIDLPWTDGLAGHA